MYDIVINNDGTPLILNGSVEQCSYREYILQKLYRALFDLDIREILGPDISNLSAMKAALQSHMVESFYGDADIDSSNINVDAQAGDTTEIVKYTVTYEGTNPQGEGFTVDIGIPFSVSENGITSVDYSPEWLSNRNESIPVDIEIWVDVPVQTSMIEIPSVPYRKTTNDSIIDVPPIYLLRDGEISMDSNTETIEIEIITDQLNYQVSSYLEHYSPLEHTITSVVIDDTNVSYNVSERFGDIVYTCEDQEGYINITVTYIKAIAITREYVVDKSTTSLCVYKLKPERGDIYAVFNKTVIPGRYMIKYTGVQEV